MCRAFEHQMLEQVGEPRAARLFVLRPHVVPQVDRNDRTAVILVNDHVEPIVERLFYERHIHVNQLDRSAATAVPWHGVHAYDTRRARLTT